VDDKQNQQDIQDELKAAEISTELSDAELDQVAGGDAVMLERPNPVLQPSPTGERSLNFQPQVKR
jgi:hypothetical protein